MEYLIHRKRSPFPKGEGKNYLLDFTSVLIQWFLNKNDARYATKCEAEEWDIAVAMSIDDNKAVGGIYGGVCQNIIVSVHYIPRQNNVHL